MSGAQETQPARLLSRLKAAAASNAVGADIVEVAPAYDVAEITALAAATMGWEYLCLLASKK